MTADVAVAPRRAALRRRARGLAVATIAWNSVECVLAVAAGVAAGSIALVGFGLDSLVEVFAGAVVLWQLHRDDRHRERRALRLIAVSFFALAAYVVVEAVRDLLVGADAEQSTVGVTLAVVSLLVMPALAWAKRRTGLALADPVVVADAAETALCSSLSAVLLVGLLLADIGLGWADPLAALVIAGLAAREGIEAWRGEACCDTAEARTGLSS
ncbi:MAG: cation transporter [Acidimicrobiia bacterium]|nr:cation transporter [Acidimicrobiia bacterium]